MELLHVLEAVHLGDDLFLSLQGAGDWFAGEFQLLDDRVLALELLVVGAVNPLVDGPHLGVEVQGAVGHGGAGEGEAVLDPVGEPGDP